MGWIISLDSGGSKTYCLVCDYCGNVVSMGRGGPANQNFVSVLEAQNSIRAAIKQAVEQAGIDRSQIDCVFATVLVSGANLLEVTGEYVENSCVHFIGEPEAVLASILGDEPGVVAASGTGSFVCGRNTRDEIRVVGGLGAVLGDEGSGFDIGCKALRACIYQLDKRGPRTVMTELLMEKWGIAVEESGSWSVFSNICSKVYGNPDYRREIASLTRLVKTAADLQDEAAIGILKKAGMDMADQVRALLGSFPIGVESVKIGWQGGTWKCGTIMLQAFQEGVLKAGFPVTFHAPGFHPVFGTYLAGIKKLKIPVGSNILRNIMDCNPIVDKAL